MFSSFSGLKPNLSNVNELHMITEGVKKVIYGIKCIDLNKEAIKILGTLYLYERKIELENNFQKVLLDTICVILRNTDNYSFIFFFLLFLFTKFIAFI